MRKLEVPFHADAAVAQPPVRHALTIQAEIDMIRVTNAGSFAPVAFSGVKQTVGEGECPLLIAEVDRPRLTTHTQSDRVELIKIPYQVARNVLKAQHVAETVLQPGRQLRDAGVLERFDEKVLREIYRIDNVLQAEEVGLSPHHLLFAQTKQVGPEEVPTEVQIGFARRVVNQIAVVTFEAQIANRLLDVYAMPAFGRDTIYVVDELDVLGNWLREQKGANQHTLESSRVVAESLEQRQASGLSGALKFREADSRETGSVIAESVRY